MSDNNFSAVSLFIGLIFGAIIATVIMGICFIFGVGIFEYCSLARRTCGANDYYLDPGDALANGYNIDELLFLSQNNELLYRQGLKSTDCIPENQDVIIQYPQYCNFQTHYGQFVEGRSISFGSPQYVLSTGGTIDSIGNCLPLLDSPQFMGGLPLLKWDPTTIN
jgi:hypothetical protein